MPAPAPLECQRADCAYRTPQNTPTWEQVLQLMQAHREDAHGAAPVGGAGGGHLRHKPAPVPRPEIDMNATESEWTFFKSEFNRYKRTIGLTTTREITDELWHCMTVKLRTLMQSQTIAQTYISHAL